MIDEESPKEEEVKAEAVASPTSQEADFDDYNSPEPKGKMEASELKESKVKEVRINEAKNTEAPARKLNLDEEAADEKKSPAV